MRFPQEPYDYNLNTRMKAEYNLTGMKADGMEDFKDWSRQDSHAKVSKLFWAFQEGQKNTILDLGINVDVASLAWRSRLRNWPDAIHQASSK